MCLPNQGLSLGAPLSSILFEDIETIEVSTLIQSISLSSPGSVARVISLYLTHYSSFVSYYVDASSQVIWEIMSALMKCCL